MDPIKPHRGNPWGTWTLKFTAIPRRRRVFSCLTQISGRGRVWSLRVVIGLPKGYCLFRCFFEEFGPVTAPV